MTTKHGTSPSGPASLQPPSPSFFLKDVRPMTTAGGVDHLLQDGPVLVGRRAGEPVVQLPGTVAERVLTAVVRAGHVPVQ